MFVFGGGGGGTSTTRGGGGCGAGTTKADSIAAMQRPGPRRTRPNVETKCAIGRSTQEGTATYRRNISVFQQLRFSPGAASPASKTHTVRRDWRSSHRWWRQSQYGCVSRPSAVRY